MKRQTITTALIIGLLAVLGGCNTPTETEYEEEIERSYTKTIERTYANAFERALIDSSEAAYMSRDSMLTLLPSSYHDNIPETGYWFFNRTDGVLLPFALTVDAVDYYSNLIDSIEVGVTHQHIYLAEFEYLASVSFEESYLFESEFESELLPPEQFEQVYVVVLRMQWNHYCIPLENCGLYISSTRIVVFNESGSLKKIFLDGWPIISVV